MARGRDLLGECPLWDERAQALWWVDILAPALKQLDPATGALRQNPLPEPMGSFAFREAGGLVAALKSGVFLMDPSYTQVTPLATPEPAQPRNRCNDGRCDRAGRFWVGTMMEGTPREATGALYRIDPGGACIAFKRGIGVPNSLAWSPDGRTMYFADSPRKLIWRYDYDPSTGEATNERVFADAAQMRGYPDGSCVDADGGLWNAEYGGWRVVRYAPDGRLDRVIELPVAKPTCCAFGGANLDTLYVTSAAQGLKPHELHEQPLAGSVLAVRPGSTGLAESRFKG